ncbi:MAG: amidohydrolase family protein [Candidatus Brocadiia bacterium]
MRIIDFHTHAFPDELAQRAVPALAAEADVTPALDGTVGDLLRSMDATGIDAAVVASIATRPQQFDAILRWSAAIASPRLVPFPSVHPADPEAAQRVQAVRAAGLKGIKLHPYYQDFDLDEERVFPLYRAVEETGLVLLCHTGFDIAFPRIRKCDPARIAAVLEAFPNLKLVTSHLGAWMDWEGVRRHLLGRPVYMDISYALDQMPRESARELLLSHPQDYLLFATDSPWADQGATLALFRSFQVGAEREAAVLHANAERLLASVV